MRRLRFLLPKLAALALMAVALPVAAHTTDQAFKMRPVAKFPLPTVNSDLAFWGDYAVHGYYGSDTDPRGGVRFFDISNPAHPKLIRDFACDGPQNDPILWDRNGNDVPDLMLLAVDRTMASPECGAARAAHEAPDGWEGVRVFTLSDNPANPFRRIRQVEAVYTDCGAHTITLWPDELKDTGKLVVYVSSYPLRPGPTCGDTEHLNTANPYDGDPGSPSNPLHGVIQVLKVPVDRPAAAREFTQLPISYPGDPDGRIEWCERGLCAPGVLENAAVACHDIVVHVHMRLAGAACAEQGQIWEVNKNGLPDTANPLVIGDDEVTSGGTGNIPGAVDFFHSAMFNNDATVVNWVDESFGSGCPPTTAYESRPWNPAGGTHKTGRMFFADAETGEFFSEFQVGDVRPDDAPGSYCSAHMGMQVMGTNRDVLVNAWYTGGVNVLDFTRPTRLKELAYYDFANVTESETSGSDNWAAYPYTGPQFRRGTGRGIPVYATDGLGDPNGRGFVVFRTLLNRPSHTVDHLNPQTMD
jgi:hypothetical protein